MAKRKKQKSNSKSVVTVSWSFLLYETSVMKNQNHQELPNFNLANIELYGFGGTRGIELCPDNEEDAESNDASQAQE